MNEEKTKKEISAILEKCHNPILLCSFGKDSMVMLHLVHSIKKIPILQWRFQGQPEKYEFSDRIIKEWELTVYDYPPTYVDIVCSGNEFSAIGLRDIGNGGLAYVAVDLLKPIDNNFGCALRDFVNYPTISSFNYPWGLTFIGNKSCDYDPVLKTVFIKKSIVMVGNTILYCPLRDWTDEDIWKYTEKYNVPYNDKRYDKDNGYKDFEDKTYNAESYYVCTDCVNPNLDKMVHCPLLGCEKKNIESIMNYEEKLKIYKAGMHYIDFGGN